MDSPHFAASAGIPHESEILTSQKLAVCPIKKVWRCQYQYYYIVLLLCTYVYTGPYVGNIVSFPLSALLCQYGFDGGWPSVFYVFGKFTITIFLDRAQVYYSEYTCIYSKYFQF